MNLSDLDNGNLYLTVMPHISLSGTSFGRTEQFLTLMPSKSLATEFFPDEVDTYISIFKRRIEHLVGGHVTGYELEKELAKDGRIVVRVTQNVQP